MYIYILPRRNVYIFFWGWLYVASVLCIGWSGIMRIGEVIMARRSDLVLPCDSAPGLRCILAKIRTPKTRGRSAKHQSARIDPCDLVRSQQFTRILTRSSRSGPIAFEEAFCLFDAGDWAGRCQEGEPGSL